MGPYAGELVLGVLGVLGVDVRDQARKASGHRLSSSRR
jgi:hypothetical protein